MDALAHEPALHVGERDHDRVDPPVADHRLEFGETGVLGVTGVVVAHRTPLRSCGRLLGPRPGRDGEGPVG